MWMDVNFKEVEEAEAVEEVIECERSVRDRQGRGKVNLMSMARFSLDHGLAVRRQRILVQVRCSCIQQFVPTLIDGAPSSYHRPPSA